MYDEWDILAADFQQGANDYWAGILPEGWEDPRMQARSPYVAGWYMASMWETRPGWVLDADGEPFQDEED